MLGGMPRAVKAKPLNESGRNAHSNPPPPNLTIHLLELRRKRERAEGGGSLNKGRAVAAPSFLFLAALLFPCHSFFFLRPDTHILPRASALPCMRRRVGMKKKPHSRNRSPSPPG